MNTQIISGKVSPEKKAETQAAKEQQTAYCCDSDRIGRRGCNSDLIDRRGCNSDWNHWIGRRSCNSDWIGRRGCCSDWIGRRGCDSTVETAMDRPSWLRLISKAPRRLGALLAASEIQSSPNRADSRGMPRDSAIQSKLAGAHLAGELPSVALRPGRRHTSSHLALASPSFHRPPPPDSTPARVRLSRART